MIKVDKKLIYEFWCTDCTASWFSEKLPRDYHCPFCYVRSHLVGDLSNGAVTGES